MRFRLDKTMSENFSCLRFYLTLTTAISRVTKSTKVAYIDYHILSFIIFSKYLMLCKHDDDRFKNIYSYFTGDYIAS